MIEARLLDRVVQSDANCWVWQGCGVRYGALRVNGQMRLVHRVAYEAFVGPIPAGMTIDHLCRVTKCINPAHLEVVPMAENNRRSSSPTALNAVKTHCPLGHPYAGDNLEVRPDGRRRCRLCRRIANAGASTRLRLLAGGKNP